MKNNESADIPASLRGYKTRLNKKTGKVEMYWPEERSDSDSGGESDGSSTPSEEYINEN